MFMDDFFFWQVGGQIFEKFYLKIQSQKLLRHKTQEKKLNQ